MTSGVVGKTGKKAPIKAKTRLKKPKRMKMLFFISDTIPKMKKVDFDISRLDRFAQGVSFGDKTRFIARTLPGEKGSAQIYRSAKGVEFGWPLNINSKSEYRIQADCSHYEQCQGCHYRHVDYENEIEFKLNNFIFELRKFLDGSAVKVEVLKNKRVDYRNRIQLHYDKARKKLGFINPRLKKIVEVPNCLVVKPNIREKLNELYKSQNWLELTPEKNRGHLEIYDIDNQLKLSWNKHYADGGFSQVHEELNNQLYEWIEENILSQDMKVLDLFGGGGNLSQRVPNSNRKVVDLYSSTVNMPFVHMDLDNEEAFVYAADLMIIDPPRRGFKRIKEWVKLNSPSKILYISCDISSLKRDLAQLDNYKVERAMMIDFFGGTYHYESLVYLQRV